MFKGGRLSEKELEAVKADPKGGKEKKRAMMVAILNLEVGDYIDVEDSHYSYVSVRARVSELSSDLMDRVFRTQRIPLATRVIRVG
jgi:uncharacterized Ntn-hydrolase superfamily protein